MHSTLLLHTGRRAPFSRLRGPSATLPTFKSRCWCGGWWACPSRSGRHPRSGRGARCRCSRRSSCVSLPSSVCRACYQTASHRPRFRGCRTKSHFWTSAPSISSSLVWPLVCTPGSPRRPHLPPFPPSPQSPRPRARATAAARLSHRRCRPRRPLIRPMVAPRPYGVSRLWERGRWCVLTRVTTHPPYPCAGRTRTSTGVAELGGARGPRPRKGGCPAVASAAREPVHCDTGRRVPVQPPKRQRDQRHLSYETGLPPLPPRTYLYGPRGA
jgi:hypothetical protein